jgi:hypothetical protein
MLIAQQVRLPRPEAQRVAMPAPLAERVHQPAPAADRVMLHRRINPRSVVVVSGSLRVAQGGDIGNPVSRSVVTGALRTSKVHQPAGQSRTVVGGSLALNLVRSIGGSSMAFTAVNLLLDSEGEPVLDHRGLPIMTVPQNWIVIGGGGAWSQRTGYTGSLALNRVRNPSPVCRMVATGGLAMQVMTPIDDPYSSTVVATGGIAAQRVSNAEPVCTMVATGSVEVNT